ncbi:MAG: hypothetical protein RBU37_24810, partial [Myxococcota bacterium]|nr:hypothetical protein [Myxococcota bacterium]
PEPELSDLPLELPDESELPEDTALDLSELDEAEDEQAEELDNTDSDADEEELEPPPYLAAAEYCEASVDFFCDYYLRCARMAVDSVEACRAAFLETCNQRYEPHYVVLESLGALRLSRAGLEQCQAHLAQVECAQQRFDLDGGCGQMWEGQRGEDAACAPGIESFVCDGQHSCVLSLDFCGSCKPAGGIGEPCAGGTRCRPEATCVEGECVARPLPGEACSAELPCLSGSRCVDELCEGFAVVAVGESCDQLRRCPYLSECVGGVCRGSALLGESCSSTVPCASGYCGAGQCQPLVSEGECSASGQCVSGLCLEGQCSSLPGACFD